MSRDESKEQRAAGIDYFHESKSFALSIVSIIPLILVYHCGIVQSGYGVRNMAESWLVGPLQLVGLEAAHLLNIALVIALIAVLWRSERTASVSLMLVVAMIGEGAFYAALLYKGGPTIAGLLDERASHVIFAVDFTPAAPLFLALGAGVYEELVFRLLLLGGGAWLMRKVFLWNRTWSVAVALVVSSVFFATVHHIGPLGEPFESYSFLFRTVCGLLLGVVFLVRGLGVAVWTHAIYNALVMFQLADAWYSPLGNGGF